jgi:hypothetical protein
MQREEGADADPFILLSFGPLRFSRSLTSHPPGGDVLCTLPSCAGRALCTCSRGTCPAPCVGLHAAALDQHGWTELFRERVRPLDQTIMFLSHNAYFRTVGAQQFQLLVDTGSYESLLLHCFASPHATHNAGQIHG